jgi:hypothetical protein
MIVGTRQQRSKLVNPALSFQGHSLSPSASVRNLGVIFDSDLTLKPHISNICKTSFLYIRQLRRIRPLLDLNTAKILASSLTISKLDYCNSLLFGLPDSSLHRVQLIQNSLARAVVRSTSRYNHITPVLNSLHWLPIAKRIQFKIAVITFKALTLKQPSYLSDLLVPVQPSARRSAQQHLLQLPLIKSANGRRSFSFSAPSVWNSLPVSLRSLTSIASFRSSLKTYLFSS